MVGQFWMQIYTYYKTPQTHTQVLALRGSVSRKDGLKLKREK